MEQAFEADLAVLRGVEELEQRVLQADLQIRVGAAAGGRGSVPWSQVKGMGSLEPGERFPQGKRGGSRTRGDLQAPAADPPHPMGRGGGLCTTLELACEVSEACGGSPSAKTLPPPQGWMCPSPDSVRGDLQYCEHKAEALEELGGRGRREGPVPRREASNPLDLAVLRLGALEQNVERRYLKEPLWAPHDVVLEKALLTGPLGSDLGGTEM